MNIFKLEVHPAADIFPMLSDDELHELADDIKANGLIHPIVIKDNVLIDGRNRRAACKIAKVTPETVELNGADLEAYIISSNIHRRQMTKGQKAMAVAMVYPEPSKLKRKDSCSYLKEDLNQKSLSYARTILRHTPGAAKNVLSGAESLNSAYETAKKKKKEEDSYENKLVVLREFDSSLADMVVEERLTLEGATAEMKERVTIKEQQIATLNKGLRSIFGYHSMFINEATAAESLAHIKENRRAFEFLLTEIHFISEYSNQIKEALKNDEN